MNKKGIKTKISVILILSFLIGTIAQVGQSGFTASSSNDVSKRLILKPMKEHSDDLRKLYSVMAEPIPIQLPDVSEDYTQLTIIDTPAEFSWNDNRGIDLTTPARRRILFLKEGSLFCS